MDIKTVKGDLIVIPFILVIGDNDEVYVPDGKTKIIFSLTDGLYSKKSLFEQEVGIDGTMRAIIPSRITEKLEPSKTYYYDVCVLYSDGQRETPFRGTIRLYPSHHELIRNESNTDEIGGDDGN